MEIWTDHIDKKSPGGGTAGSVVRMHHVPDVIIYRWLDEIVDGGDVYLSPGGGGSGF